MQVTKYEIIRLAKGTEFKTGADILILKGWFATSLYVASKLAALAKSRFGGEWVIAHNGAETVTVWVGFQASDFVAPAYPVRKAVKPRKALRRKVA